MKFNYKMFLMKLQGLLSRIVKSKLFIYFIITILLGLVIVLFSSKKRVDVDEDFYKNDVLEQRKAEREITEYNDIEMSEINRISKLLTFFFNDVIVTKNATIDGLSEFYTNVNSYDIQIIKASKAGSQFEVTVIIGVPKENADELLYVPYKKYQVVISQTSQGLKVDYINIIGE